MDNVNINGLPVYEALVDAENQGMSMVSLVDAPAVLTDFLKFKAQNPEEPVAEPEKMLFAVADEEKRLVYGVLMRADFPIYRRQKVDGKEMEFYLIFKADTIRTMAEKYLKESNQNNVNLDHKDNTEVEGVNMVQMFIKDSAKGVDPDGFAEVADGSLFAEYHVQNDEVWDAIKEGTYKGFSLEGLFAFAPEESQEYVDKVVESTEEFAEHSKEHKMSKMNKIKATLAKFLVKTEFASVTTDKAILSWDGEDDLKAEDEVYIIDEDGNKSVPEDGDYKTEDGKVIVVKDGKVSEIKDAEAEVADEDKEPENEETEVDARVAFHQVLKEHFEASYEDRLRKISSAVYATIDSEKESAYIIEASDNYAIASILAFDPYEEHTYRYNLSWENDEVTLGEKEEVKQMYVPMDFVSPWDKAPEEPEEKEPEVDEEKEQMRAELASVKAELEALKKKPSAVPAHEEYEHMNANPEKENRAAQIASFRKRK